MVVGVMGRGMVYRSNSGKDSKVKCWYIST